MNHMELQSQFRERLIKFLREELSNDEYEGKLQIAAVITNKINYFIDIVSNNANSNFETKSLLSEGADIIRREQLITNINGGKKDG